MSEDLKEAFLVAALETFKKLSESPELKNYRIYREPTKSLKRKRNTHVALGVGGKCISVERATSSLPFRWVLVVSAQKSARQSVLKIRGYRQSCQLR